MKLHSALIPAIALVFVAAFSPAAAFASTTTPTEPIFHSQEVNTPISTSLSENWSGYATNSGSNYTSITGTWIVPAVTASTSLAADATWVGIGGAAGGTDLIQAGTQAIVRDGTPAYEAWYELLPAASVSVDMNMRAGDSVSTSLTQIAPNQWSISIIDHTNGQSFANTVNYDSSLSSAEWIQEMPTTTNGPIPLDNFNSIPFTNATAVTNNVSENLLQLNAQAVTLVDGDRGSDQVLSYPSPIGTDGASFTVTRSASGSFSNFGSRHARMNVGGFVIPTFPVSPIPMPISIPTSSTSAPQVQTQTYSKDGYTIQITTYTQEF